MPADDIAELKQAIREAVDRRVRTLNLQWGVQMPNPLLPENPANRFREGGPTDMDAFGTGYDSGTGLTTIPFTVDVSIVTDGTTGDIVTGS